MLPRPQLELAGSDTERSDGRPEKEPEPSPPTGPAADSPSTNRDTKRCDASTNVCCKVISFPVQLFYCLMSVLDLNSSFPLLHLVLSQKKKTFLSKMKLNRSYKKDKILKRLKRRTAAQ